MQIAKAQAGTVRVGDAGYPQLRTEYFGAGGSGMKKLGAGRPHKYQPINGSSGTVLVVALGIMLVACGRSDDASRTSPSAPAIEAGNPRCRLPLTHWRSISGDLDLSGRRGISLLVDNRGFPVWNGINVDWDTVNLYAKHDAGLKPRKHLIFQSDPSRSCAQLTQDLVTLAKRFECNPQRCEFGLHHVQSTVVTLPPFH